MSNAKHNVLMSVYKVLLIYCISSLVLYTREFRENSDDTDFDVADWIHFRYKLVSYRYLEQ